MKNVFKIETRKTEWVLWDITKISSGKILQELLFDGENQNVFWEFDNFDVSCYFTHFTKGDYLKIHNGRYECEYKIEYIYNKEIKCFCRKPLITVIKNIERRPGLVIIKWRNNEITSPEVIAETQRQLAEADNDPEMILYTSCHSRELK